MKISQWFIDANIIKNLLLKKKKVIYKIYGHTSNCKSKINSNLLNFLESKNKINVNYFFGFKNNNLSKNQELISLHDIN